MIVLHEVNKDVKVSYMHISMNNAEMLGQGSQYVTRLKVGKAENRYSCPVGNSVLSLTTASVAALRSLELQGGSNMTGTDCV